MRESSKFELFSNLNGGLSTRPTPLLVEAGKKMQSPDLKNVNFFRTGGISKRLGKTQQGNSLLSGNISQTTSDALGSVGVTALTSTQLYLTSVTAGSSFSLSSAITKLYIATGTSATVSFVVWSDSAGTPLASLGGSDSQVLTTTALSDVLFTFSTPVSIVSGSTYWVGIKVEYIAAPATVAFSVRNSPATGAKQSSTNGVSWSAAVKAMYYVGYSSSAGSPIQGIYDFRPTPTTRQQLAVTNGSLYKRDKSGSSFVNTWTSLYASFTAGQDVLSSFATLKDYAFVSNYANGTNRVWDGAAAYTIKQGFQATFSASAAAGGAVTAGVYKVMAVTSLDSGGYRASAPVTVTTAAGNLTIAVSSIVADGTAATDFGFDISATATKWFMTAAGGETYYKIPAANMSVANPPANNTTTFNITALTGLTTANTLIVEYSLPQGYFTSQVAAPAVKYMTAWQDFLVMAGDPNNPSRVWFSEQNAPNVWSTYGQIYGNYLEIDDGDGDVITGVFQWNGSLYVSKQHSLHIVEFTGNAAAPFQRRRLPGDIGALSGFTFKDVGAYFVFLSERGIAGCVGSIASIAPGMENILDLFDPNDADRFNLAACTYSTAGHNRVLGQVWFGVSSTSATTRDKVLIFDYTNKCFWLDDGISGNYFTEVGDANGFFSAWSGDYSGQIFQHDSGTTDNGAAIDWYFTTPALGMKDPYAWKHFDKLMVAGDKQASGTLSIDVYVDRSTTATKTLTVDMTTDRMLTGYLTQIGVRGKTVQFKFRNSESGVPVHIDSFGVYFDNVGVQA